jgi:tripeptide aminopeptidase
MQQVIQEFARSLAAVRVTLDAQRVIQDAIAVQQIPAPTFDEKKRAAFVRDRFARSRLQDIEIDEVSNAYGRWPGTDSTRPALLVAAHTDTVFPLDTDLTVRREEGRIYGPGLGDNSLGVAGLLALLDAFQEYDLRPAVDVWFVADSREEGLGDLGGMRAVWQKLGPRLGAAVVLEGMALGRIYHAGIAVRRLRITCHAPGGHSWLHFGRPNAIHGLIELGAWIVALKPAEQPRTTFNIGLIEGGHSVNSLAMSAEMYLDLRSESPESLATLEEQVLSAMEALQRPSLEFTSEVVGDRPIGQISTDHPLVRLAVAALEATGCQPTYETGSTDANVLLANGLPTVTIGLSYGGNAHRFNEYIETGPITDGIWQLILLVLAAADQMGRE